MAVFIIILFQRSDTNHAASSECIKPDKENEPASLGWNCAWRFQVCHPHNHLLVLAGEHFGIWRLLLTAPWVPRGELVPYVRNKTPSKLELPNIYPVITCRERVDTAQRKHTLFVFKYSFTIWQHNDPTERYWGFKHALLQFSICPLYCTKLQKITP